ncbi:hypothetical protein JNUCC42_04310 [Brevibacterium sp. JNUCC-42]|nr:hypothetical protein JNUCC42_04310 [Brevibacterium sp. JNUCC-42]
MKTQKYLAISLSILSIISVDIGTSFAAQQPAKKTAVQTNQSQVVRDKIFKLSDATLNGAIKDGKKTSEQYNLFMKSYDLPVIENKIKLFNPTAEIVTPYNLVFSESYYYNQQMKPYTLAQAKQTAASFKGYIPFSIITYGNDVNYLDSSSAVLKQGNKVIQPLSIDGKDEMPSHTEYFPKTPSYRAIIVASFPLDQIDFSKEATLVYMYAGQELSVSYKVNFGLYK